MLIRSQPNGIHGILDFAAVNGIYTDGPQSHKLTGTHVTSPFHLFAVETLRDQHHLRIGPAIPTDVFVWAIGEPARREVTKIGGLPYWPAHQPWPQQDNGGPCRFLAQINFADSRDLVPDLPGDILLVFAKDPEKWAGASSKGVFLAWQKITEQSLIDATTLHLLLTNTVEAEIQRQLVISRRASASAAEFLTQLGHEVQSFDEDKTYLRLKRQLTFCCYGVRHRTFDYPNAVSVSELGNIGQSYRLPIIEGTKIGGAPFNIQSNTQIPGQFLCQLASVQAAPRVPYPWANHATPFTRGFEENGIHSQSWMIGDMGCLYFSIDNGLVYINGESY